MELSELKNLYDNLLKDEDFDKLDLGLGYPNIFQILRITKNEIRHSNFLSWLLDPNQSHKLGDIFLKRFLREVFLSDRFDGIDQADVEGMDLTKVEIRREWKNIDILIELENVVVCVENKVLSKEHSNQLKRYKEIIENEFPNHHQTFVFLTPEGYPTRDESDNYEPISYEFIVDSLERIVSVYGESLNEKIKNYIKDYISSIKRELRGTDKLTELSKKIYQNHQELFDFIIIKRELRATVKLTELSKKIYQNHQELFDFIIKHKPDAVDDLSEIMNQEIQKRGWILGSQNKYCVRWLTPRIKDLIYYNTKTNNGWKKKESFLFEVIIYPPTNNLNFKTVLSPCDPKYNSRRVEEMLLEINGSKKSWGKKWLVNINYKYKFIYDEIPSMTNEEMRVEVNKFLDRITPRVTSVEKKFLEHKDELIKLKLF